MSKDSEAPSNTYRIAGVVIVVVTALLVLRLVFKYHPASSPPRMVVRVVQSSGVHNFGKLEGGRRAVATVRLADGKFVLAYTKFAEPVSTGDAVTLSVQPQIGGDPIYTVIARNNR